LSSFYEKKVVQSYKKLPEAIVPEVGHGPKMRQNEMFALVFLWFFHYSSHVLWPIHKGNGMGQGSIGLLQARFFL